MCRLWPFRSGAGRDYGYGQLFVSSSQHASCGDVNRLRKLPKLLDADIRAKNLRAVRLAVRGNGGKSHAQTRIQCCPSACDNGIVWLFSLLERTWIGLRGADGSYRN